MTKIHKVDRNLRLEDKENALFTWHSALLIASIALITTNSIYEISDLIVGIDSAAAMVGSYFTAKKFNHNYYVDRRNDIRIDAKKRLEQAKDSLELGDEISAENIELDLVELGIISKKSEGKFEKDSGFRLPTSASGQHLKEDYNKYKVGIKRSELRDAFLAAEALTIEELEKRTLPDKTLNRAIPLVGIIAGATLIACNYLIFKSVGFEIGGFVSAASASFVFGSTNSTNEQINQAIDRKIDIKEKTKGREPTIGSTEKKRKEPRVILNSVDDLDLVRKKKILSKPKSEQPSYHPIKATAVIPVKSPTEMKLIGTEIDTHGRISRKYKVDLDNDKKTRPKSAPPTGGIVR